jgi:protein-tyrosine phosphatase/predicted RNA-binding Zn-ribbon protein involved in translation (DUF1610 family)
MANDPNEYLRIIAAEKDSYYCPECEEYDDNPVLGMDDRAWCHTCGTMLIKAYPDYDIACPECDYIQSEDPKTSGSTPQYWCPKCGAKTVEFDPSIEDPQATKAEKGVESIVINHCLTCGYVDQTGGADFCPNDGTELTKSTGWDVWPDEEVVEPDAETEYASIVKDKDSPIVTTKYVECDNCGGWFPIRSDDPSYSDPKQTVLCPKCGAKFVDTTDVYGKDWQYNAYGIPERITDPKAPTLQEHYSKKKEPGQTGWGDYSYYYSGKDGYYGTTTTKWEPKSTLAGEIPIGTPGKLYHGALYFGKEEMKITFEDLKSKDVSVIWNLLDDSRGTKEESENFEIVIATPIKDYGLPKSQTKFFEDAKYVLSLLKGGKSVFIHCQAGHGRTGTAVATLLIMSGMSIVDGIETAIDNCHGPETEDQIYFVVDLFTVNKPEDQDWWSYGESDKIKKTEEYKQIIIQK